MAIPKGTTRAKCPCVLQGGINAASDYIVLDQLTKKFEGSQKKRCLTMAANRR